MGLASRVAGTSVSDPGFLQEAHGKQINNKIQRWIALTTQEVERVLQIRVLPNTNLSGETSRGFVGRVRCFINL